MLKKVSLLFVLCCIFAACVPAACAVGDDPAGSEVAVISEIVETETTEEAEPAEGEISDAQYKAYVLGFLLYFTIVSLFYFCYKFFRMFF